MSLHKISILFIFLVAPFLGISQTVGIKIISNGNVGVGEANPTEKLHVDGAVKIGDTTTSCTSSNAGVIRWNGTCFEGCNGTAWVSLSNDTACGGSGSGASCSDGIQNQGETGIDCGGPCPVCPPTCSDGIQNQGETGIDCGGPCPACPPSCSDGIQNQGETGVDCGGPCPPCGSGGCSNLALSGIATQSSTYFGRVASRAIDDNTNGHWSLNSLSCTTNDVEAWWEVDLGSASTIEEVKIWNRTDCCSNRLANFYVLLSASPFPSTDLNTCLNDPNVSDVFMPGTYGAEIDVVVPSVSAKYVRVQLSGQNYLTLAEVQIYDCTGNFSVSNTPEDSEIMNDGSTGTDETGSTFLKDDLNFYKEIQLTEDNLPALHKIMPNPADEYSTIAFSLPENYIDAKILFYNQTGSLIHTEMLDGFSKTGLLRVDSKLLSDGLYLVQLMVDNKNLDSKKMIIAH